MRVFCGYDEREAAGFHAFMQSILHTARNPISVTPLSGSQRDGTNSFTYSRFLVPWLCDFRGWAIWVDGSDMLCRDDLGQLLEQSDHRAAVFVVKHDYQPKHVRKYIGTEMEADNSAYPRKNWSSVILWDCGHYLNRMLTPEYVKQASGQDLHRFAWLPDERIGSLPSEWNWLDEYGENPQAKILHYTNGIPGFYHYREAPHSCEWRDAIRKMTRGIDGDQRNV